MRSWVRSGTKTLVIASAIVSVVTHAGLITAWVLETLPAPGVPETSMTTRPFYIPPPDRVVTQPGSGETVHYVTLEGPGGFGTGGGARMMGEARPVSSNPAPRSQSATRDTASAPAVAPTTGKDSVYSVLDVDTAVVRLPNSAAPAYPIALLKARVQGFVNATYIVDTTGFADTASFHVIQATNPEFVASVKDALPYMRFQSAKMGSVKVRQMVQQQFSFRITDTISAEAKKKP